MNAKAEFAERKAGSESLGNTFANGGELPKRGNSPRTRATRGLESHLRHAGKDFGVLVVARRHEDGGFTAHDFAVFRSAAEQFSFTIGNARIHCEAHENRAMEGELQNARAVQRVLLPQGDPVIAGFRISGTNLPVRIISGNYYDYISLGGRKLGIAIANSPARARKWTTSRRWPSSASLLTPQNLRVFPTDAHAIA